MGRVVNFLIPASASEAFAAQIAAFYSALISLRWTDWQPTVTVCFGEHFSTELHTTVFERFPQLKYVNATFAEVGHPNAWFYNQIDALYRFARRDADVYVRVDADVLPVGYLEPILDLVSASNSIAGTIAHYRFPDSRYRNRAAWNAVATHLPGRSLSFDYCYSLTDVKQPPDERASPFYLNDGCVFFSKSYFERFVPLYLQLRPRIMPQLELPYFAGQIALSLAAAQVELPRIALPLRFNFPNDESASIRYPEELADVRLFHYLREDEFSRSTIFNARESYEAFLQAPLSRTNSAFRDKVRSVLGESFPFRAEPCQRTAATSTASSEPDVPTLEGLTRTSGLEALMRSKRQLIASFGISEGFERYLKLMSLPASLPLRNLSLMGQGRYAEVFADHFVVTHRGGVPFTIKPIKVVGEGTSTLFRSVSRATHIARISDAVVRGGSALIQTKYHALLEFQDEELDLFDCEFDIDPSIFAGTRHQALVIDGHSDPEGFDLEEAFTLLGPQLGAFGDFMMQYLPRLVWAQMTGNLPPVPVLINRHIPHTIGQALTLLSPGTSFVEVDPMQPVRVKHLWCASNLTYAPAREIMDERYSFEHAIPGPSLIMPVVRELRERSKGLSSVGPERGKKVFLARRPERWRSIVNATMIHDIVQRHGFSIAYPEDLEFSAQVQMVREATHIVSPEGSALFLCYFANPGTRVAILNHTMVQNLNGYDAYFDNLDIVTFTSPVVRPDRVFPHRADFLINPQAFEEFLVDWAR